MKKYKSLLSLDVFDEFGVLDILLALFLLLIWLQIRKYFNCKTAILHYCTTVAAGNNRCM